MRACILYHPHSEFSRKVEEYAHDFKRFNNKEIELLSLESMEGARIASLYDIVRYPAVLALREDGQLMKEWQGDNLPLMREVAAYLD